MVQNIETLPPPAPVRTSSLGHEILFMDTAVRQSSMLATGVRAGVEVILLPTQQDGVEQITQVLRKRRGLTCMHIVAPGGTSSLQLGTTVLSLNTLERYVWDLTVWSNALTANAELLIYTSDLARGVRGEEFVGHLSELIGVKVAASRSKTGNSLLGGNWNLELQTLPCQTLPVFTSETLAAYDALL